MYPSDLGRARNQAANSEYPTKQRLVHTPRKPNGNIGMGTESVNKRESNTESEEQLSPTQELQSYREWLVQTGYRVSETYDKSVMTLSGGALAISLTFIHEIVTTPKLGTVKFLAVGWTLLTLSVVAILSSMLTSQWALNKAIEQVDKKKIFDERPGKGSAWITAGLNIVALITFILGVAALAYFSIVNISNLGTAGIPKL